MGGNPRKKYYIKKEKGDKIMTNYNIGKILHHGIFGVETCLGKCTYRAVEQAGGWAIYKCPTDLKGTEWLDNEGNKLNAWSLSQMIPAEKQWDYLQAYGKKVIY